MGAMRASGESVAVASPAARGAVGNVGRKTTVGWVGGWGGRRAKRFVGGTAVDRMVIDLCFRTPALTPL